MISKIKIFIAGAVRQASTLVRLGALHRRANIGLPPPTPNRELTAWMTG